MTLSGIFVLPLSLVLGPLLLAALQVTNGLGSVLSALPVLPLDSGVARLDRRQLLRVAALLLLQFGPMTGLLLPGKLSRFALALGIDTSLALPLSGEHLLDQRLLARHVAPKVSVRYAQESTHLKQSSNMSTNA